MSEPKKPSLWDRLLGRDAAPAPAPEPAEAPRSNPEAPASPEAQPDSQAAGDETVDRTPEPDHELANPPSHDEPGPPETRPEWIEAGHPDAPDPEPDTPDTIWDPFDAEPAHLEPQADIPVDAQADLQADLQADPVPAQPAVAPDPAAAVPPVVEPERKRSWFQRLSDGLKRSSDQLSGSISSVFTKRRLDEAQLSDLEDILIQADLGIDTATTITDRLRAEKFDKDVSAEDVRTILAQEIEAVLAPVARPLEIDTTQKPFVILMVGVNGSGKTTTIGKLTAKLRAEGRTVLLAAGDTFRAAAVEQLQVWGQRTDAEVVTRPAGADAAGLAFDAVTRARDMGTDVVIVDTAGRLQNRAELMDELEKVIRVIGKVVPGAPHATLLTLDATTGQNALNQVEIFGQKAGVSGLVMTKLDGTARGGILVAIARKFGLPVHFIGVGESIGDLEPFQAGDFARAMVGGTQPREFGA